MAQAPNGKAISDSNVLPMFDAALVRYLISL